MFGRLAGRHPSVLPLWPSIELRKVAAVPWITGFYLFFMGAPRSVRSLQHTCRARPRPASWRGLLILRTETLRLETCECYSKSASTLRRGIAVDESPELSHGPTRVLEIALVQLHQCQADSKIVAWLQGMCCSQIVELDGSRSDWFRGPARSAARRSMASTRSDLLRARSA